MLRTRLICLIPALATFSLQNAQAQPAPPAAPVQIAPAAVPQSVTDGSMQVTWEVRNRFRLFREERDFLLHAESLRAGSVLASEQRLEVQSDGRGWARNMVNRLCIDLAGRVTEPCNRDNVRESYLTPTEHAVTVRLTGALRWLATAPSSTRKVTVRGRALGSSDVFR